MATNKEIDLELDRIGRGISFYAINPTNEDEEKEKFFKDKDYNPHFRYEKYSEDIGELQDKLQSLCPDNTIMGYLLKQSRNIDYSMLNMIKHRGMQKFTKYSILCYGAPDADLVKKAKKILKDLKPIKEKKDLTTEDIKKRMKYAFLKYGFNWKITEKKMTASAAVKAGEKELVIKKDEKFSERIIKRLIVHEIGTHIMRCENGCQQPYKLFERGLPNYLMTEEGLAVVNEERHNCLDNAVLRRYAARVIAVDMALRHSFKEVFREMAKHLDEEQAWRTTVRAKRGLGDTSQQGGCTKDFAYLRGYFAVKKFIEEGGDVQKLYYGKIGIQHVEYMDKIPDLVEPRIIPTFRYLKFAMDNVGNIVAGAIRFINGKKEEKQGECLQSETEES